MSVQREAMLKLVLVGAFALGLGGCASEGDDPAQGLAPLCNADLEQSSSSGTIGLRYPSTIIKGVDLGERDTDWVAVQRAATAVENPDCPARLASTPAGPPCAADSQIDLGGQLVTVGVPLADLAAIPTGAVHVRARGGDLLGATPDPSNVLVEINRKSDGVPLLVAGAFTYSGPQTMGPPWTFGSLRLRLDSTPVCRNRQLDSCRRSFLSKALAVDGPDRTVRLEPGESAEFPTLEGRYRVTARAFVERGGGEGAECSDLQLPRASFEIVRLGD